MVQITNLFLQSKGKKMKSIVMFDITGYDSGELRTYRSFDIVNIEPIEDNRFDPYDHNIEEFVNFKSISDNFSGVDDFDMIFSTSLNESEKTYETILSLPFFFNKTRLEIIIETFNKQFPFCSYEYITPLNFERLDGYGPTDFLLTFETKFPFEKVYKENIFKKKEFNHVITDNFDINKIYEDNIEITAIKDINGKSVILEGDFHLGGLYPEIVDLMKENKKSFKIIKNLYAEPQNLKYITDCDNLIIQTTGFNHEGLSLLIESFKKLRYVPKRVFFVLEEIYIKDPMFEGVNFYKLTPNKIIKL
jgi:hypothetical protein